MAGGEAGGGSGVCTQSKGSSLDTSRKTFQPWAFPCRLGRHLPDRFGVSLFLALLFQPVFCFAAEAADVLIIFQRNVLAPQLPQSSKSWMRKSSSTNSTFESTCPCTLASMSASNALWKFGINILRGYSCCWILFPPPYPTPPFK